MTIIIVAFIENPLRALRSFAPLREIFKNLFNTYLIFFIISFLLVSNVFAEKLKEYHTPNTMANFTLEILAKKVPQIITSIEDGYLMQGNLIISPNDLLQLQAGEILYFKENAQLIIEGKIIAEGTSSNRIIFTAEEKNNHWQGIYFTPSSRDDINILKWVIIEHSIIGISCNISSPNIDNVTFQYSKNAAIKLKDSEIIIKESNFLYNPIAIIADSSTPQIDNCQFQHNQIGLDFIHNSTPKIGDNLFSDNEIDIQFDQTSALWKPPIKKERSEEEAYRRIYLYAIAGQYMPLLNYYNDEYKPYDKKLNSNLEFGLRISWPVNKYPKFHYGGEITYWNADLEFNIENYDSTAYNWLNEGLYKHNISIIPLDLMMTYSPMETSFFTPYFGASIGLDIIMEKIELREADNTPIIDDTERVYGMHISGIIGLLFNFNSRFGLFAEGRGLLGIYESDPTFYPTLGGRQIDFSGWRYRAGLRYAP